MTTILVGPENDEDQGGVIRRKLEADTAALLASLDFSGIESTRATDFEVERSVLMTRRSPEEFETFKGVEVLDEVSNKVGHGLCRARYDPCMCNEGGNARGSEATFIGSRLDIKINSCHRDRCDRTSLVANWNGSSEETPDRRSPIQFLRHSRRPVPTVYDILVHEAGHALGIGWGTIRRYHSRRKARFSLIPCRTP